MRRTSRGRIRNTKFIINKANQHRLLGRFAPRNDGLTSCTSLREMRLSRMTKQSHRRPTPTLPIYRTDAHHRSQIRFLVLFLQKKDVSLNQSKYNLSRLSGLHNSLVLRLLRRFASRNDGECAINSPRRVIPAKAGIHPRIMLVQNWILAFARMTYRGVRRTSREGIRNTKFIINKANQHRLLRRFAPRNDGLQIKANLAHISYRCASPIADQFFGTFLK